MTRWLVVIALVAGCKKEAEPEKVETPDVPGMKVPTPSVFPDAAPRAPLGRALSQTESSFAGTWAAKVGGDASITRLQKDGTFVAPPGVGIGGCIWLELYDDLTGFRDECAVIDGNATALEGKNSLTGKVERVAFDWSAPDAGNVTITYRADVYLPDKGPFRTWKLSFVRQEGETFVFQESFPDLGPDVHREATWEIIPGRYLGDGK